MRSDSTITDVSNRDVLVYGLGRFGGAAGAIRFLASQGARVFVADDSPAETLAESVEALRDVDVADWFFQVPIEQLPEHEVLVANPGLKPNHPLLMAAVDNGVRVTSEVELFAERCPADLVAVTGSNGKSTTASMIAHLVSASGRRCHLGGNFGGSLLSRLDEIQPEDLVVLELSSFQLARMNDQSFEASVSVVTNFTPNHLDWHPTLQHYRDSKQRVVGLASGGVSILPGDDQEFAEWPVTSNQSFFGEDRGEPGVFLADGSIIFRTPRGEEAVPQWSLRVPGEHNLRNSLAAAAVAFAAGVEPVQIATAIQNFTGVPYRLQIVGTYEGRTFVNDSSATTPESVVRALSAFRQPMVLIAGGADKGLDLTPIARTATSSARAACWIGSTGPGLFETAQTADPDFHQDCHETLDSAFQAAVEVSKSGDIVILSPGCASFGMYANYRQRGQHFDQLVQRLNQSESP